MTPTAPAMLLGMAGRLAGLAGGAPDAFAAFELNILALASATLVQDVERGVAVRVAELDDIRAVVDDAVALGAPVAPVDGVGGAGDLELTALDARLAGARRSLIDAHAWAEAQSTPEAGALDDRIWSVMRASNERRQPR